MLGFWTLPLVGNEITSSTEYMICGSLEREQKPLTKTVTTNYKTNVFFSICTIEVDKIISVSSETNFTAKIGEPSFHVFNNYSTDNDEQLIQISLVSNEDSCILVSIQPRKEGVSIAGFVKLFHENVKFMHTYKSNIYVIITSCPNHFVENLVQIKMFFVFKQGLLVHNNCMHFRHQCRCFVYSLASSVGTNRSNCSIDSNIPYIFGPWKVYIFCCSNETKGVSFEYITLMEWNEITALE